MRRGEGLSNQPTELRRNITETPEEKESREVVESVFKDGGFLFHTSFPQELHPNKQAGFATAVDKNRHDEYSISKGGVGWRKEDLISSGVSEVVSFSQEVKDIFETREIKTGFFGMSTKQKREKVGEKKVLHSEIFSYGKNEPLINVVYETIDLDGNFLDYSGRSGQVIKINIALPESIANMLMLQIKKDPKIIRLILDKARKEKANIDDESWENGSLKTNGHPMRPPFEDWAKINDGASKLYIIENGDNSKVDPQKVISF